ncbi:MAG: precorrin-8X methylmutase [Desulfobacteraceae bacterium]|nr:precorrin-8X methylmutase [Desulfobacteraceae bacterium]
MEMIMLIGHGSPKKEANCMETVGQMLHGQLHPGCTAACVRICYLQYHSPTFPEAVHAAAADGATRIVVHPYFLNAGVHVTEDIPALLREAAARYPRVTFTCTEPLGISAEIVQIVGSRIREAAGIAPGAIEERSFEAIEREIDLSGLPGEQKPLVKRVIHTTADFDFRSSLLFHPQAVRAGVAAIRGGRSILTDVEMVKAGINKRALGRWGGEVICRIGAKSGAADKTRAEEALAEALDDKVGIVAIGNAPTALLACIELIRQGRARPDLVVGVPVGFVRAVEAKALLGAQEFPFITTVGRKGGSPVAAALVNGLLKLAEAET